MAITIGNSSIKDIYVGDSKVKAVYLGDELVYGAQTDPPAEEDVSGLTHIITYTYNIPESGETVVPELYYNYSSATTDYKVIIQSNNGEKIQASIYSSVLPITIQTTNYAQYFTSIDSINFEKIEFLSNSFYYCINLEYVNFVGYGNYEHEPGSINIFGYKCTALKEIMAAYVYEDAVLNIIESLPPRPEGDGIMTVGRHITIANLPTVEGWTYVQ